MDVPDPVLPVLLIGTLLAVAAGCGSNSVAGRAADAGQDVSPETAGKLPGPDAGCPADAMGGGGSCPINFCGEVKSVAALALGEVANTGADSLCTPPYACVPGSPTADGTALQLSCVMPPSGTAAFGMPCVTAGATGARCSDDALCIEAAAGTANAGASFCAALCRTDSDCPTGAYCLEYRSATLPNGSYANLGMCTPADKVVQNPCRREADCAAGQGCVPFGTRTSLYACKAGGARSLGELCTAGSQCRSGDCQDRSGFAPGPGTRGYCAGVCGKNSDCGATQRCVRRVLSNNGTPSEPRDDVVAGYCQTLFVPVAAQGCTADGDCVTRADGSDACDASVGLCYKRGAAVGAPCAADTGCDLGAICLKGPRYAGGYCAATGCAPGASSGVDACPGTRSACSQRASDQPIHVCYESCAQAGDCSRFSQSYVCEEPQAGQPKICLGGA